MINNHPSSELLVEYSSASMAIAPSVAITTHLQFCIKCRQVIHTLNQVGGEILENLPQEPVSEELLGDLLLRISKMPQQHSDERHPEATSTAVVQQTLPENIQRLLPDGNLAWRFLSPSLRVATMSVGEESHELALHRIKAGGKTPKHTHTGQEITVVLTGYFSDEKGLYQCGDFLVREQGESHRPWASQNEECICLSVLASPIKLTGLKQIFNPLLKFAPS